MSDSAIDEMGWIGIDAAEKRHTPDLEQLKVKRHNQITHEGGPAACDGELEVTDVSAAYANYSHVFLRCKKCLTVTAIPNPLATVKPDPNDKTSWQNRKDTGDGDPF